MDAAGVHLNADQSHACCETERLDIDPKPHDCIDLLRHLDLLHTRKQIDNTIVQPIVSLSAFAVSVRLLETFSRGDAVRETQVHEPPASTVLIRSTEILV